MMITICAEIHANILSVEQTLPPYISVTHFIHVFCERYRTENAWNRQKSRRFAIKHFRLLVSSFTHSCIVLKFKSHFAVRERGHSTFPVAS